MHATPRAAAAAELIARFRRQRPLRSGSLIVTLFGDAIMPRGGAIALGSLIALAAPFGLNERLVRTATARLAKDGWLKGRRAGKLSEYRLSRDGRERFADATKRIYGEPDSRMVGPAGRWSSCRRCGPRSARSSRKNSSGADLASSRPRSLHTRNSIPAPSARSARGPLAKAMVFDANLAAGDAPQRLVALGWDLDDLGLRYRRFVKRFERVLAALQGCRASRCGGLFHRAHAADPRIPPPALARPPAALAAAAG